VIGARAIGMDMPAVVNPGPVAARITFFAPVSLLFFFAVLVILGSVRGINLHPMNYFSWPPGVSRFSFSLLPGGFDPHDGGVPHGGSGFPGACDRLPLEGSRRQVRPPLRRGATGLHGPVQLQLLLRGLTGITITVGRL